MKKLLILIMLISISVNAQFELNMKSVTTGYYKCYVDGVYVDKHTSQSKADMHCGELSSNNPDKIVGFTHPEFTKIDVSGLPEALSIDSIYVTRDTDNEGNIIRAFRDNRYDTTCYILTNEVGMISYPCDSMINSQYKYHLKRTINRQIGETSYENLEVPFQFLEVWLDGLTFHWIISDESVRTSSWLNDIPFKEYIPDSSTKVLDGYEIYFGIPADSSGKTLRIENENIYGEVITYSIVLQFQ